MTLSYWVWQCPAGLDIQSLSFSCPFTPAGCGTLGNCHGLVPGSFLLVLCVCGTVLFCTAQWGMAPFVSLMTCISLLVMDITDIIHGKVDDEEKQHFIPFQQWVSGLDPRWFQAQVSHRIGGVNAEAGGRSPFVAGEERASLLEDCQLGPQQNTLFRGLHVGFRERWLNIP